MSGLNVSLVSPSVLAKLEVISKYPFQAAAKKKMLFFTFHLENGIVILRIERCCANFKSRTKLSGGSCITTENEKPTILEEQRLGPGGTDQLWQSRQETRR